MFLTPLSGPAVSYPALGGGLKRVLRFVWGTFVLVPSKKLIYYQEY